MKVIAKPRVTRSYPIIVTVEKLPRVMEVLSEDSNDDSATAADVLCVHHGISSGGSNRDGQLP